MIRLGQNMEPLQMSATNSNNWPNKEDFKKFKTNGAISRKTLGNPTVSQTA